MQPAVCEVSRIVTAAAPGTVVAQVESLAQDIPKKKEIAKKKKKEKRKSWTSKGTLNSVKRHKMGDYIFELHI